MTPTQELRIATTEIEFTRNELARKARPVRLLIESIFKNDPIVLAEFRAETERLRLDESLDKAEQPTIVGGFGSLTAAQVENLKRRFDGRMNKNA